MLTIIKKHIWYTPSNFKDIEILAHVASDVTEL
jgi:hypothetical protein